MGALAALKISGKPFIGIIMIGKTVANNHNARLIFNEEEPKSFN